MPKVVSDAFREAFWDSTTDKVAIVLLEIDYNDPSSGIGTLRFALNTEVVNQSKAGTTVGVTQITGSGLGAQSISVVSSDGFSEGDPIAIFLDGGRVFFTSVSATPVSLESMIIAPGLPADTSASSGNAIFWEGSSGGPAGTVLLPFLPYPFEVNWPQDVAGRSAQATLRIDNIDRTITETLRALVDAPTVKLSIVLSDTPNVVEMETPYLVWETTSVDAYSVEGTLSGPRILNRTYPMDDFTPTTFPSLFL